jgi:hypothetical protein
MTSIFQTIETDLANIFTPAETAVVAFFKGLLSGAAELPEQAFDIVAQAVADAEAKGGSGVEKFDYAAQAILNNFESAAITYIENVVNGMVEAAVAALPSKSA